jgi:glycosyltransferase involved in cell wall biosynthesis
MTGYRGEVEVDASGKAHLTTAEHYKKSVSCNTWKAAMHFAGSLKERQIKIAFFSATPQGGGVALMRHALIRFFRTIGVHCKWFVPQPRPEVFRVTKTNHNILQGVAEPNECLTEDQKSLLREWVQTNSSRKWDSGGGPLAARKDGGADVIIVDDPQMPDLVPIAKKMDPHRPVIFRSHIQIRSDLADQAGTATSEVWNWLWDKVKHADIFISHPVREFVPNGIDFEKVGWLPATTDWLDGLNKELAEYDAQYYAHEFKMTCFRQQMHPLNFPDRDYIVQIARFDPSKGIPDVLASYAILRRKYLKNFSQKETPQLVIAGHGSVDDPDGSRIFNLTLYLLETEYNDIAKDVVLQRVGPADQILNTLLGYAKIALQLSTREGFEVKVSEALHKGIPVIATKAGGIPLQVQHWKGGYLVDVGDNEAVAKHLYDLLSDTALYERMSKFAAENVSDEVGTVGNALAWMYLADSLTKGKDVKPGGAWINDLARKTAGVPYAKEENRLPRNLEMLALTERAHEPCA